jgi:hypothetical protein
MDFAFDETKAILSKSLSLIEKTINRLKQLDERHFPTDSSISARDLLIDALEKLRDSENLAPMSHEVLYQRVLSFQELVVILEKSSVENIPWPLVGYCDEIWLECFTDKGPKIFYSVTAKHNYSIHNFTKKVEGLLRDILPPSKLGLSITEQDIYCLQIASIENENLPLYAIVGHEFGHAIFRSKRKEVVSSLLKHFTQDMRSKILLDLKNATHSRGGRLSPRFFSVIEKFAEELFCDLVGVMLMGPAFFLSLYEMSWGQETRNIHIISLLKQDIHIKAYPSLLLRLHYVKLLSDLDDFCNEANKSFTELKFEPLQRITECLSTVPTSHDSGILRVYPSSDSDSLPIQDVLSNNFESIKEAVGKYLEECKTLLQDWWPDRFKPISTRDLSALLSRLEQSILPNIIRDDRFNTLLGRPASFETILNASALFRMHLLVSRDNDLTDFPKETDVIERLTAKAFEVSFIQRQFNKWKREQ